MYDNLKLKLHVVFFFFNLFLLHYTILQTDVKVFSTIFKTCEENLAVYSHIYRYLYSTCNWHMYSDCKFCKKKDAQNQLFVFQNFRKKWIYR